MVIRTERQTWPLWECLKPESLAMLMQLQWKAYGLKLGLMADFYRDVEDVEEIDQLMRKPPEYRGKVWPGG